MTKKVTTEEVISRFKITHGNKYNYHLVEYTGYGKKVKIICPIHGVFEQGVWTHLSGIGCPKCSSILSAKNRTLTTDEFIEKAISIHENKYEYHQVEYINTKTKVKIICSIHGVFEQRPSDHLQGQGCPVCSKNRTLTTEEFIEKAISVYGVRFDYHLVEYINTITKISIICPIHGVFERKPSEHLQGKSCPKCKDTPKCTRTPTGRKNKTISKEKVIIKFRNVYGDKYDYSLVEYKGCKEKVSIICPIHGIFEQNPVTHLLGRGCPICIEENKTTNVIKKFIDVHGENKFDYSLVEYVNAKTKVKIICLIHGIFEQTPNNHLTGHGCPDCTSYHLLDFYRYHPKGQELGHYYQLRLFNETESFYKRGVTSMTIEKRFTKNNLPYEYEIIDDFVMTNLDSIEQEEFDEIKYGHLSYKPNIKFSGYKECYTEKISMVLDYNL